MIVHSCRKASRYWINTAWMKACVNLKKIKEQQHMFLTQWWGPDKVDLSISLICLMGPSLSLKYIWPHSLHCELTWHMPAREMCIGKSTVFEGLCSRLSNVYGKWRTVAYPREKKKVMQQRVVIWHRVKLYNKRKCDNVIIDQLWCGEGSPGTSSGKKSCDT